MALSDIVDMARLILRDKAYPYRWQDETVVRYVNDGVKEIRRMRPDAQIDANGDLYTYSDISLTAPFTYTEVDANNRFSGYDGIGGWARNTFPTLYFSVVSASDVRIYATSEDLALSRDYVGSFDASSTGLKSITPALRRGVISGFGGSVNVTSTPSAGNTATITAVNPTMCIDDEIYDDALANYVASGCLAEDSDDTQNQARADACMQTFYKLLMG